MRGDEGSSNKKAKGSLIMSPQKIFLSSIIITAMTGCYSNEICIDPSKKVVLNPSHHDLSRLSIRTEGESGISYLELSLSNHHHRYKFNLTEENPDFDVTYHATKSNNFYLKPNSIYLITNSSNGDAASNSVTFQTDSINEIIVLDGNSCR